MLIFINYYITFFFVLGCLPIVASDPNIGSKEIFLRFDSAVKDEGSLEGFTDHHGVVVVNQGGIFCLFALKLIRVFPAFIDKEVAEVVTDFDGSGEVDGLNGVLEFAVNKNKTRGASPCDTAKPIWGTFSTRSW